MADIILPAAAYTEKHATFANTEGRAQRTYPAVGPPGDARQDWAVLRAISEVSGLQLPYDDVEGLRRRVREIAPGLLELGDVQAAEFSALNTVAKDAEVGTFTPQKWLS